MDKKSAYKITSAIKEIIPEAHMGNLNGINTVNVTVKAEIPRIKMPPNTMVSQAFAKIASSSHKGATLYKVQLPIDASHNVYELSHKLAKLGITETQFVTETN